MKLLRLAPENTKFDFMRFRRVSYPFSASLSIVSVLLFFFVGMNFGIDFAGGTQVELRAKSGNRRYRHACAAPPKSLGLGAVEVQRSGADTDAVMRVGLQPGGEAAQQTAIGKLRQAFARRIRFSQRRRRRARASRANWCRKARLASSSRSSPC